MTLPPEYSESWSVSEGAFTHSTEAQGEELQGEQGKEGTDPPPERKKRGRKPQRPLDPIRKKTEEKDKYWLRAFRAYMRAYYPTVRERLPSEEQEFWDFHLSPSGKPGKGNKFASYGKTYKQFIFARPSFCQFFRQWFREFGEFELTKKCPRGTDLWIVFHHYASHDLFYYKEVQEQTGLDCTNSPLLTVDGSPLIQPESTPMQIDDFSLAPDSYADDLLNLPDADFAK